MDRSLEQYAAGSGLALGAAIGGTIATLSGMESALALIAGFGVVGGMIVGAIAGRFAEANLSRDDWVFRVGSFTLAISLLIGGLLGLLAAWSFDAPIEIGLAVGAVGGGVFAVLQAAFIVQFVQRAESNMAEDSPV